MSESEEQEEKEFIVDLGSITVFARDKEEALEKACKLLEDCPREIVVDQVIEWD